MTPILVRHGIKTKRTRSSWIHDYKALTYRKYGPCDINIDTEKYKAGINFLDNHLRINPAQARSMLVEYRGVSQSFPSHKKACIVAHSNGTNVTLGFLKLAEANGLQFGTVVLIGAAIHSDIEKSGVLSLLRCGTVEKFVAYVSPDDRVIRKLENFPGFYGSLGSKGFHYQGSSISTSSLVTREFTGYAHSEYFTHENIINTTKQINKDFGL